MATTATGVIALTGGAVGVAGPAMFLGLKMIASASEVKQNVLRNELRTQTISPGKSGSGFLYLPPAVAGGRITLRIPISMSDQSEPLHFDFPVAEIPRPKH